MGYTTGREQGCRVFPKWKSRSIPSIGAVSWQCSLYARAKIEYYQLNSCPFEAAFSGIDHVWCLAGPGIFSYFISPILIVTLFEWANKIMVI